MKKADEYQERYLNHQERKTQLLESDDVIIEKKFIQYTLLEQTALKEIMFNRRSQRKFTPQKITSEEWKWIKTAIQIAPSSCNRQAIYGMLADPKTAEEYLVGGSRWIDKADKVILLFGDKKAYKSPNEIGFMPWLDAGFVAQNIYLIAEVTGLGCCFVNPNIREANKQSFEKEFGNDYFCGAIALGHYKKKAKTPPLRPVEKVLRK